MLKVHRPIWHPPNTLDQHHLEESWGITGHLGESRGFAEHRGESQGESRDTAGQRRATRSIAGHVRASQAIVRHHNRACWGIRVWYTIVYVCREYYRANKEQLIAENLKVCFHCPTYFMVINKHNVYKMGNTLYSCIFVHLSILSQNYILK